MTKPITYKHRLEYMFLRLIVFSLQLFPLLLIQALCRLTGYLVWIISPFRLPVTFRNISNIFPEKSRAEKMTLLRQAYITVCQTFGLIFVLHRKDLISTIHNAKITGREKLEQALAQNKGVILTTCHACWFEAYFAWFTMSGLPVSLIYQEQGNPLTNAFFIRQRQRFGKNLEHLSSRAKMPAYQEALNRGRLLIISLDQSHGHRGTAVDFFNEKLACAKGSAVLHLRSKAPVFTSVYYMKEGCLHIDFAEVPLPEYDTINEETINDISSRAIVPYETFIRHYPQQWFSLFHRLWSKEKAYYPPVQRTINDIFPK